MTLMREAIQRTDIVPITSPIGMEEWRRRVDAPLRAQEVAFLRQGRDLLSLSGSVRMLGEVAKLLKEDGIDDAIRSNVATGSRVTMQDSLRQAWTDKIIAGEEIEYKVGRAGAVLTEIGWNYREARDEEKDTLVQSHNVISIAVFTATGDIMVNSDGEQIVQRRVWETRSGKILLEDMVAAAYKKPLTVSSSSYLSY